MKEANLNVNHIVDCIEVIAVLGTLKDNHHKAVKKASEALLCLDIPCDAIEPYHRHTKDEKHCHAEGELDKWL